MNFFSINFESFFIKIFVNFFKKIFVKILKCIELTPRRPAEGSTRRRGGIRAEARRAREAPGPGSGRTERRRGRRKRCRCVNGHMILISYLDIESEEVVNGKRSFKTSLPPHAH